MRGLLRLISSQAVVFIVLGLMSPSFLQAQTVTGTILGNVADSSGAAVPNAQVTVTNQDTGVVRTAVTTAEGVYTVPSLLAGKYSVEAQAQGFTPAQVKDIVLNVGSNSRVDLVLTVGAVTQQVTVTEALPTVETTSSEVSQVMDANLIDAVPLNARDLQQLALIQPGVTMVYTGSYGHTLSVGGDRISNNRFLTEGIDVSLFSKQSPVSLASFNMMGADAVKEFKVITDNPPAEYGETSGGVMNTIFKSGTNNLHGTVYEYYRNSAFDARNFFDGAKVPPLHRHQFGASLGGPIRKDKTFFFANYEGFVADTSQSFVAAMPDAAARGTGATAPCLAAGVGVTFACPTGTPVGTPFVVGQLPCGVGTGPALFSAANPAANGTCAAGVPAGTMTNVPVSSAMYRIFFGGYSGNPGVPLMPACNGGEILSAAGLPTGTCNFLSNPDQAVREHFGVIKVDHSFTSSNSISISYNIDPSTSYTPAQTGITADDIYFRKQILSLQDTQIVSTNVVNTFRFGIGRIYYSGNMDLTVGVGGISKVDPEVFVPPNPLIVDKSPYPQFPAIAVNGNQIQTLGAQATGTANFIPRFNGYTSGNLNEDVNWQLGRHAVQFGFQGRKWDDNIENYMSNPRGTYTFSNLAQFLAGGPANSFGWWVNGYTDPLNGQTYTATFARGEGMYTVGVYGEDTFKFRPNLTLSYGLRWEYASSPHEEYNRISNLWGRGNPPSCSPYTCATPTVGFPWYNPPKHNFAPRVGFNWDPFKKGKTSVRGGAGIFYNELEDSFWYPSIAAQPPFVIPVTLTSSTVGGGVSIPFINVGTPGTGSGSNSALNQFLAAPLPKQTYGGVESPFFKTPVKYSFNLAIQQELPAHLSLLIAYVGSQGRDLGRTMSWQDYFPTTIEQPGQLPAVNGVPIPGSVVNPNCKAPGEISCYYWAGAGLNNANLLGNAVGVNGATANTVPYATLCGPNAAGGGANRTNCFNNPNWGSSITGQVNDANLYYNSLQTALERRMSPGLLVRFNYTYAECVTDSGFDQPTSLSNGGSAAWPLIYISSAARGRCAYLGTHSANLTLTYVSHWGNNLRSGLAKHLLTNWELTSQSLVQSGLPFGITEGANVSRYNTTPNSAGADRPDWAQPNALCPNPTPNGAINKGNIANYVNVNCFVPAPSGYLGNVGNMVFTGPPLINTDVSLRKTFRLNESKSFVFSADMFNAFNRANFNPPSVSSAFTTSLAQNTQFGRIGVNTNTPTTTTSRQFQIDGRFIF
ncbi:MAG TPA: TonB-dependent receptor [Candidatus Acidoferrales bacterium]|nr:TonB-dependent receptor [Candidatus Acidoferrales bacterium]